MKNKTQQLLSILLCCVMLLGLLPTTSLAAETTTGSGMRILKASATARALGVGKI